MSACQIQAIINTLGAKDASDLNGWCNGKWSSDKNYSLTNNQTCTVSNDKYPKYPKGTIFTCQNNSIVSTVTTDGGKTFKDTAGNVYNSVGGGSLVKTPTPAPTPVPTPVVAAPASVVKAPAPVVKAPAPVVKPPASSNTMLIIIVVLLLLGVGGFFFMNSRKKISPMTAFGKKLAKIVKV